MRARVRMKRVPRTYDTYAAMCPNSEHTFPVVIRDTGTNGIPSFTPATKGCPCFQGAEQERPWPRTWIAVFEY